MLITVLHKKKLKRFVILLIVIALCASVFAYLNNITYPLIVELSETQAENKVNNVINEASKKILQIRSFYDDFYTYEKNNDGEVVLIISNTSSINQLVALAKIEVQEALNTLDDMQIDLHLGAFTGSSLLAKNGPTLKVNIIPIGNSVTKLESYFYQKGINQTIHRLVLCIVAKVNLIIPFKAKDCIVTTSIVLAEDIIIGRVPDTYVGDMQTDDLSNSIFDILSLNT